MRLLLAALFAFSVMIGTASAQDPSEKRLKESPRHGEWVNVKHGDRVVEAYIVYPEVKDKATSVVVIHEIFGLSPWVQSLTDQLAEAGYIAIAPDLLSGKGPKGGGTKEFSGNELGKAIRDLPPDQITKDLNATAAYVGKLDAANGKVAVCGFCWGGGQCFRYATNNRDLKAAFVFYGATPLHPESVDKINCPVYGFYGENDERINASIPRTAELMKADKKTYEPVIYAGAGHGFMRAGEMPNASPANKKGREDAWARWKKLLAKL
jgi:carboxymethylenebutenolidase